MTGTLHEDLCKFMIISRSVLLRIGNVLDTSCRENEKTNIVRLVTFSANGVVYEIMWSNMVQSWRGSKAVCPMSCFTVCKRTQK
jgi:hypothetical protein